MVTKGTCKCGLECPFKIENVFTFDPSVQCEKLTRASEAVSIVSPLTGEVHVCNHSVRAAKNESVSTTGDSCVSISTTGDSYVSISTTGDSYVSISTTGDSYVSISTTGDSYVSISTTGDSYVSISTTGDSYVSISTTGDSFVSVLKVFFL